MRRMQKRNTPALQHGSYSVTTSSGNVLSDVHSLQTSALSIMFVLDLSETHFTRIIQFQLSTCMGFVCIHIHIVRLRGLCSLPIGLLSECILCLAVILFSLSHMRPQLPGWEHDDIIILLPPPLSFQEKRRQLAIGETVPKNLEGSGSSVETQSLWWLTGES